MRGIYTSRVWSMFPFKAYICTAYTLELNSFANAVFAEICQEQSDLLIKIIIACLLWLTCIFYKKFYYMVSSHAIFTPSSALRAISKPDRLVFEIFYSETYFVPCVR